MNKVFTMNNGDRYAIFDEIYDSDRRFAIALKLEGDNPTNDMVICELKLAKDGTLYLVDIKDESIYRFISSEFIKRLTKK